MKWEGRYGGGTEFYSVINSPRSTKCGRREIYKFDRKLVFFSLRRTIPITYIFRRTAPRPGPGRGSIRERARANAAALPAPSISSPDELEPSFINDHVVVFVRAKKVRWIIILCFAFFHRCYRSQCVCRPKNAYNDSIIILYVSRAVRNRVDYRIIQKPKNNTSRTNIILYWLETTVEKKNTSAKKISRQKSVVVVHRTASFISFIRVYVHSVTPDQYY